VEVTEEGYYRWQKGQMVQDAFPRMSADQIELLVTGTHPKCWESIFPEEEDDYCEGCEKAEAFLDDPITIAYGLGGEMLPLFKHTCKREEG
jgi:hypothetical protein